MSEKPALFPLFYLPPIQWFSLLKKEGQKGLVEHFEHFPKQTYRNRAHIYSPNGLLSLTVPVKKGSRNHTPYQNVAISYEMDWQRIHWMSLQSCYRSSAYFEYYEDDFAPFYHQKFETLFEYNWSLLQLILGLIKMPSELHYTEEFFKTVEGKDYRNNISYKKQNDYKPPAYFQVFQERHGFLPDLSIVDLLFNQGPQSQLYL